MTPLRLTTTLFALLFAAACGGLDGDAEAQLSEMQLHLDAIPASPTNAHADDPGARELGRKLFFDKGLSSDGTIACASCHRASEGFSNARPLSLGVGGQEGTRHAMPVTALPFQSFFLWDGKADSAWLQPLKAIENTREMNFTRLEVAHRMAGQYRAQYEATFGPLPSLEDLPARGAPGAATWDALSAKQQDDVQRVFTNAGKAIEAYERQLTCADTRFDRWTRGEVQLTNEERRGAGQFVDGGCIRCHAGPAFSDGRFHNLGLGSATSAPDNGRSDGIKSLLADPFNGAGAYSDNPEFGRQKLTGVALEAGTVGAFRTASLRGAGQRTFYGHQGRIRDLRDFITTTYRNRGGGGGGGGRGRGDDDDRTSNGGTLDPLLRGVDVGDVDALAAFIHTLDCPTPAPELLSP